MKLQLHIIIKGYVTDRSVYLDYIRLLLQDSECCSFSSAEHEILNLLKNTHFHLEGESLPHCGLNMQLCLSILCGPYSNVSLLSCTQVLIADYFLFTLEHDVSQRIYEIHHYT